MTPAPTTTPTFKDAAGRTWHIKFNIGVAKRIRDELGVDFGNLEDGRLFLQLGADPFRFAAVLWLVCESQAQTKSVTPDDFAEGLDGDVVDAALEALIAATVNFTRAPMRGPLAAILEKTTTAHRMALETAEAWAQQNGQKLIDQATTKTRESLERLGSPSAS